MESHFQRIQPPPIPELPCSQMQLEGKPIEHTGRAGPWEEVRLEAVGGGECRAGHGKHLTLVTQQVRAQAIECIVYGWVPGEE